MIHPASAREQVAVSQVARVGLDIEQLVDRADNDLALERRSMSLPQGPQALLTAARRAMIGT